MSLKRKELYEFSRFRLDVPERLLLRDGKRVRLPDKAFQTLCVLVRRAGELVTKDELIGEVWADSIVEENNLDQKISVLRQTLGEQRAAKGKEKFIETVRGHGYRFIPEVRTIAAANAAAPAEEPLVVGHVHAAVPKRGRRTIISIECHWPYAEGIWRSDALPKFVIMNPLVEPSVVKIVAPFRSQASPLISGRNLYGTGMSVATPKFDWKVPAVEPLMYHVPPR